MHLDHFPMIVAINNSDNVVCINALKR